MACKKCGYPNTEDAYYCARCGEDLIQEFSAVKKQTCTPINDSFALKNTHIFDSSVENHTDNHVYFENDDMTTSYEDIQSRNKSSLDGLLSELLEIELQDRNDQTIANREHESPSAHTYPFSFNKPLLTSRTHRIIEWFLIFFLIFFLFVLGISAGLWGVLHFFF